MFGALIYILIFQSARPQSCRLAAFREHSAPLKAARAVARDTNVVVTIRLKTSGARDKKTKEQYGGLPHAALLPKKRTPTSQVAAAS